METNHFGVLGFPAAHSLSPTIHSFFYKRHGLSARYDRLEVGPDDIASWLADRASGDYRGLNVTYPYKATVLPHLCQLDPFAQELEAANTLVRLEGEAKDGLLPYRGHNTDGEGLCLYLERELDLTLAGRSILILGAGNAAKSVLLALLARRPRRVVMVTRDRERYESPFFRRYVESHPELSLMTTAVSFPELLTDLDLLLQATPFGLAGCAGEIPWNLAAVSRTTTVVDLNYKSGNQTTPFLSSIGAGVRAVDGKGMLVYQAAEAFRLWWGFLPDVSGLIELL